MGEVVNGSRFKVAAIVVEAKLFDAQGRLIDTQSAPTLCVWKMSPGELAPFDIQFLLQDDIERYEVSVKAIRYTGAMVTGVTLERLQWRVSPFSGRLTAEGFMRNRSRNTYWFPTACAAVFTTRGRFILAGETLGQLTEQFGPGTRKAFGGDVGTYPVTDLGRSSASASTSRCVRMPTASSRSSAASNGCETDRMNDGRWENDERLQTSGPADAFRSPATLHALRRLLR